MNKKVTKNNQYGSPNVKFHTVCVDNFFTNPDLIREYALKLRYNTPLDGRYPGKRTQCLSEINKPLYNLIMAKIFSIYYPVNNYEISFKNAGIYFQKVKAFSEDKASLKNKGWIHPDVDCVLAGLVYLTPNYNPEAGTSLYNLKEEYKNVHDDDERQVEKNTFYLNKEISDKDYINALLKNNKRFEIKTIFKNIYNRLIMYSGSEYHKADNFYDNNKERLTMVYFINEITVNKAPIDVIKGKIDEGIESEIRE